MKTLIAIVVMTVAATTFGQQTNTLDLFRRSYELNQRLILEQYGKTLDTVMVDVEKKGDLDNFLILQTEQKRFGAEKTVPTPTEAKDSFRPASVAYYQAMSALLKQYVTALDGLIKKEGMANRLDEARLVKQEKDKIHFILADLQTHLPDPASKPPLPSRSEAMPSTKLKEGLVLYYSFQGIEAQSVSDQSWSRNDGKLFGTKRVEGRVGSARTFDGAHDYIDAGRAKSLKMSAEVTISAWIKPLLFSGYQNIVSDHSPMSNNGKMVRLNGSQLEFLLGPAGTTTVAVDLKETNRWYSVVAKYDGKEMVLVVDGKEVGRKPRGGSVAQNANSVLVGKSGFGEFFNGIIDELKVWNRALSAEEIRDVCPHR